ncbi:hypothetical protein [Nocardia sp. AG03]|uniref:hypothetical protein n=1 Tax=Nocardia sp. AG03 TaxID=3025312 RepID=UPI002418701D|nr:hypothetical protein [Nocardia sp. AG03]
MGYPGYPGYPPNGPYAPRPSRWPWVLGALVVVAALAVGVIAAGIIIVQHERNSRSAASRTVGNTIAATGPYAPPVPASPQAVPVDPQSAALDSLLAQAAADRPVVSANLAERWVPQLSAKQPGLVAADVDGRMVSWTNSEILAQNQRFRQQYPGARLVWSDDWSTFDLQGWWITLADASFADPDSANAWCDAHAIPVDDCFAKLVSNSRGSAGTTKYR